MKNKENIKTKNKRDIGYTIFYIIIFLIVSVIGLFGTSFFAYEFFNSLFFDILFLALVVLMFFVRSIQTFLRQTTCYGKIFTLTYFNLFALVFVVRPFVSNRLWVIVLLLSFIVAIILLIILAFKYIKTPYRYFITKYEPIVAMLPLLLLVLLASRQSYIGSQGMWLPVVIGGTILAIFTLFIFLKYFKNIDYFLESKSELIMSCILLILLCFSISFVTITTINYAFDDVPTPVSVQVVDKNIQSGARQVTSFYLKVKIEEKEKEIEVPVDVYHSTEIGDYIEIKLYNGALGYSYYIFEYIGTDTPIAIRNPVVGQQ